MGSAWRRRQGAEEERLAAELGAGRKKKAVSYKYVYDESLGFFSLFYYFFFCPVVCILRDLYL